MIEIEKSLPPLARDDFGFSLLEILTAITLLGLLLAIALPDWGSLISTYRLNAAARQIHADLQRAKMRAVMENTTFKIVSSAANNSYNFQREDTVLETKPLPAGIGFVVDSARSFTSRGTATSGRIQLCNLSKNERTDVIVNGVGRIRMCQLNSCNAANC
jgi:prepilin-type N-terminal cleavage/methylation domain-containing protein